MLSEVYKAYTRSLDPGGPSWWQSQMLQRLRTSRTDCFTVRVRTPHSTWPITWLIAAEAEALLCRVQSAPGYNSNRTDIVETASGWPTPCSGVDRTCRYEKTSLAIYSIKIFGEATADFAPYTSWVREY